jgi:hypothetical protein
MTHPSVSVGCIPAIFDDWTLPSVAGFAVWWTSHKFAFFGFVAGDASHRHYYYFATCRAASDPIDQMRLFEFIQIVPSPTKSALRSGNLFGYRVCDLTIMGFLRNNSIFTFFTFGQADRAKTSASYREIFDAMWLFDDKFERALAKFNEIKARRS